MRIAVINGSPKGKYSITLQTVLYLEKLFPDCKFEIIHVGQRIKVFEHDMTEALNIIDRADMLLFVYPVYTFLAPSQLHRFIELLKHSGADISGKYAAQISTSKHFFDITAHKYIEQNCCDMGLKYIKGLSADMDDLLGKRGQYEAQEFWKYVLYCAANGIYEKPYVAVNNTKDRAIYKRSVECIPKITKYPAVIVADIKEDDISLKNMIRDFRAAYPYKTTVINIREYPLQGGCLGCFKCAVSGKCVYKDGFDDFLRNEIQTAYATVYAFTISDHSMGARFKMYDDRQFCNGHRTVTEGMPVGYIINGDYKSESNLQAVIEGRGEVGHNFIAGIGTDTESIVKTAKSLAYALINGFVMPRNFYGVGGMKIFRDLIYVMQGFMKADHKFYKKNGIYDFPQKQIGTILKMKLVGALLALPDSQKMMGTKMNDAMIEPYKKVIESAHDIPFI